MSLEASVMCTCLQAGLKVPEKFAEHLYITANGYPSIKISFTGNEKLHADFQTWIMNACAHPDMHLINEPVTSWSEVTHFEQTLQALEANRFPVLSAQIAHFEQAGITPAEEADSMLRELEKLESIEAIGHKTVLVNADNNEQIWEYLPEHEGEMLSDGIAGISIGLDSAGFYIKSGDTVHFHSRALTQTVHVNDGQVNVSYRDNATGAHYACHTAVTGKRIRWPDGRWQSDQGVRFEYPQQMHVERRAQQMRDYAYIIDTLKALCRAALETGNPIRWQV